MTNKQESRLSMYLAVKDFMALYAVITAALPNIAANLAALLAFIQQIMDNSEIQSTSKLGFAESKQSLRDNLTILLVDNAKKLTAYATYTSNIVLLSEISINETQIKRL